MAFDAKTAERVRRVLSRRRDVVERKMMGTLAFMVNGTMCCSLQRDGGLLVRVGAEGRERALGEPHVEPWKVGNRTMKSFVRVGPTGIEPDSELERWIQRGIDAGG